MSRIAVLGTGRMGGAVAKKLVAHGHHVVVWNRTTERAKPLEASGITVEPSATKAVAGSDIVIVLLADGTAVDEVLNGAEGIASSISPNAVLVQMSTIGPEATDSLRRRLPPHVKLLDAPVMGSVPQVRAGELIILAAGDSDAMQLVESDLSCLGKLKPCGAVPAGSAVKILVNASMISSVVALNDMYELGRSLGLSEDVLTDSLKNSPLSAAVARSEATEAEFPIELALKDLELAIAETSHLPLLRVAQQQLALEPERSEDLSAIVKKQAQS